MLFVLLLFTLSFFEHIYYVQQMHMEQFDFSYL